MTILMLPNTSNVSAPAINPATQVRNAAVSLALAAKQGERGDDLKPDLITVMQQIAADGPNLLAPPSQGKNSTAEAVGEGAGQLFQKLESAKLVGPGADSDTAQQSGHTPQQSPSTLTHALVERRQPFPPSTGGHETSKSSQDSISPVATLLSAGRGDLFLSAISEGR